MAITYVIILIIICQNMELQQNNGSKTNPFPLYPVCQHGHKAGIHRH